MAIMMTHRRIGHLLSDLLPKGTKEEQEVETQA
jgi:hypothetical protein